MTYKTLYGSWTAQNTDGVRLVAEIDDLPELTPASASIPVTIRYHLQARKALNDSRVGIFSGNDFPVDDTYVPLATGADFFARNLLFKTRTLNMSYGTGSTVSVFADLWELTTDDIYVAIDTTFTLPPRPFQLPHPPYQPSVQKNSDTLHTVKWGWNWTDDAGGYPWKKVYLERWDNITGSWYEIATFDWYPESFVDNTTVADRVYQWRLRSWNSTGFSPYATTSKSYTTIAPHSNVRWSRPTSTSGVKVLWDINSVGNVSTEVQYSTNNGVSWSALTTASARKTETVTLTTLSNTPTYLFRARPTIDGVTGAWAVSPAMPPITAPPPPTNLYPSGIVVDAGRGVSLAWTYRTTDGTVQTAYEVEWRKATDATFTSTGKITSGLATCPMSSWVNGESYVWHVRTWGSHVNSSVWSDQAIAATAESPHTSILSPGNGSVLIGMIQHVDITYYDLESSAQTRTLLQIYAGDTATGNPLYTTQVNGATLSIPVQFLLSDATEYTVAVSVMDATGLWSDVVTTTVTTSFVNPPAPLVHGAWDSDRGAVLLAIDNTITGDIDPHHNRVFRNGQLIADSVAINSTFIDWTAPTKDPITYLVVAVSETPTYGEAPELVVAPVMDRCSEWLYVNGGPAFSVVGRFRGSPSVSEEFELDKVLRQYFGRPKQVVYVGTAEVATLNISGVLEPALGELSTVQRFKDLQRSPIICYRDAYGRRMFGTLGKVTFTQMAHGLVQVSVPIAEVEYTEEVL